MVQLSSAAAVNFRLGRAPRPADAKVTVAESSRFSTAVLCAELLKPALSLDERAIRVQPLYMYCDAWTAGTAVAAPSLPPLAPRCCPRGDRPTAFGGSSQREREMAPGAL